MLLLGADAEMAMGAEADRARAIREAASTAPLLEPFAVGEPKYHVFRLNIEPVRFRGQRYGMVRIRIPDGPPRPLVWMFTDIGTIQEYEMVRLRDDKPIRGNSRVIYPRLRDPDHDEEHDTPRRPIQLPRPWDMFELHLLGVPESLLFPAEDYVIWFRFEDARPVDLLMTAVFLNPGTPLTEVALPGIIGLPELAPR